MIAGTLLALAILACAALGLLAWQAYNPKRPASVAFALTLAALGLAFGAWPWASVRLPAGWSPLLLTDDLARLSGTLFVGLLGLSWLGGKPAFGVTTPDVFEDCTLFLLAACGGLVSISANDLFLLWAGLDLYTLCWSILRLRSGGREGQRGSAGIVGMAASLLGLALLYASFGTLEIRLLAQRVWEHGGALSVRFYAGGGLILGGTALATGFLPPYERVGTEDEAATTALGMALLLRFCLYVLGALAREWSGVLILAGIAALVWGLLSSLRTSAVPVYLNRLGTIQRGFLMLALGMAFHAQGTIALFSALVAYGLAQAILSASLRWLQQNGSEVISIESLQGLVRSSPWLGGPLLVGILSLLAAPATLGFVACVRILWAAQELELPWLVGITMLWSGLCSSSYLPVVLALVRKSTRGHVLPAPPLAMRVATVLAALGLVMLGLYPEPLFRLLRQIVGA